MSLLQRKDIRVRFTALKPDQPELPFDGVFDCKYCTYDGRVLWVVREDGWRFNVVIDGDYLMEVGEL